MTTRFRDYTRTVLRLVASAILATFTAVSLIASDPVSASSQSIQLSDFIGKVHALETKDYYLNVGYELKSEFLTTSFPLAGEPIPQTKQKLLQLLGRWRVPLQVDGDVVVIYDPVLVDLVARNPLEITIPRIDPDQVGLSAIITLFGVAAAMSDMIGRDEFERTEKLSIQSSSPIILRSALNRFTRKYHMEWTARVALAEPEPVASATADGMPAPRNPLAKGAVFIGVGGSKWLNFRADENGSRPTSDELRPIATLGELITAVFETKGRDYTFYAQVAEGGDELAKSVALTPPDIPTSVEGICEFLRRLSLGYERHGSSITLLTPIALQVGELNPMELRRSNVTITTGPIGLISLFEVGGRLESLPGKSGNVLLKTRDMRVSSGGAASLSELLVLMSSEMNCEWIAHVRPRSPPLAPGMKPAEPGLVRLTFSEKP